MSEQGWQAFLAADGLADWVVTHGGAASAFEVGSFRAAAGLAREVAAVAQAHSTDVILTISGRRLSVRLTRGLFRMEVRHIDLARRISAIAHARDAVADRSAVQEVQVAVGARPDDLNIGFWRALLAYEPLAEDNAVHPLGQSSSIRRAGACASACGRGRRCGARVATAVFETGSLVDAAELAEQVAGLADAEVSGMVLTVTAGGLSIRLTRDMWQLEQHDIGLAQRISAVARTYGASPARASASEVQLAIAAKPDESHIEFWRAVLGYAPASDDNAIDPLGHGSTVWMQGQTEEKHLRHAMHIDVSVPREHAEARVSAALNAGGRVSLTTRHRQPGSWPTARATASASRPGRTAPLRAARLGRRDHAEPRRSASDKWRGGPQWRQP